MRATVRYDNEADVLYVRFSDESAASTVSLDDLRLIDLSSAGAVVGLEFVDASGGIDLRDVPQAHRAEELIRKQDLGFPIFA